MNPISRMILATLAFGAISALPARLDAQEVVIPATLAESQQGKFMCWAAASMTAHAIVNSFEGTAPGLITPTQRLLGIYNVAHDEQEAFGPGFNITALTTAAIKAPGPRQAILNTLRDRTCPSSAAALGQCDHTGVPILQDLKFRTTASQSPLGFCELRALMAAKRPVVFQWRGLVAPVDAATRRKKGPEGDHYMVVLGTRVRPGGAEVKVWDPWPQKGAPVQKAHLQWIPYTEYANPAADHAVPGEKLGVNYFQIRRAGKPETPLPTTCNVIIPVLAPIVLAPQPIDILQRDLLPDNIRQTFGQNQLPPLEAGQRFGYSFPVVALTSAQIVANTADPDRVLKAEAAAALITVEDASGRFDTFFSVLHGRQGWERRGYVNSGIAAQMVETRKTHFDKHPEQRPRYLSDYYMLSIPSRRTFFAAFEDPRTRETMLVPTADDPAIGAYAGRAQRSRELLLRIATDIEADWARHARLKPHSGATTQ